jgi:CRP-like cAMP-binding protein
MRDDDPGERLVIADGRAKANGSGKRSASLGPGECFGEMALLYSAPRSATVTAEMDTRLLVLGSRECSELIQSFPVVGRRVLGAWLRGFREAERAQPHH